MQGKRARQPRKQHDYEAYLIDSIQLPQTSPYIFATSFHGHRGRLHRTEMPPEPRNWTEMLKHPLSQDFQIAARTEYSGLSQKHTFRIINEAEAEAGNHQILPVKWVFTYKFNENGYYTKAKARIVVRGDLQPVTEEENQAATSSARTLRLIIALIARYNLDTRQRDAVNTFLNAMLQDIVYTRMPQGFGITGKILLILQALYGLRKAPRLWQEDLSATLTAFGLAQVPNKEYLFTNHFMLVLFYINNILIVNIPTPEGRQTAALFTEALEQRYKLKNIGELNWFLNIRVTRDQEAGRIWLCQDSYIKATAARYHLNDLNQWPTTPMTLEKFQPNTDTATPAQIKEHQEKVGSISYTAIYTRPDITFAHSKLAQYLTNPSRQHINTVNRVIAYLYNTRFFALEYNSKACSRIVMTASNAAFADNHNMKSTGGYLCLLYGGPIE
jgi:hypothetical protein